MAATVSKFAQRLKDLRKQRKELSSALNDRTAGNISDEEFEKLVKNNEFRNNEKAFSRAVNNYTERNPFYKQRQKEKFDQELLDNDQNFHDILERSTKDETEKIRGSKSYQDIIKQREELKRQQEEKARNFKMQGEGYQINEDVADELSKYAEDKGLNNARRYAARKTNERMHNFVDEMNEARGDAEKVQAVRDRYGLSATDRADEFFANRGKNPTMMDYVNGYHMPQYAAGIAVGGGAIASVFSNRGARTNTELYGNPFA